MENAQGEFVRDRGVANSSVPRHRHREGCRRHKVGLFFRLAEDNGNFPNTVTCLPRQVNELPHSKLCRYCQNIFDHWPARDTCFWDKFEFLHHGNEFELKMCAENDCSLCNQFVLGSVVQSNPARLRIRERKGLKAMEGLAELRVDDESDGFYYDEGPLQLSLWIQSSEGNFLRKYCVNLSLSPKQVTIYDDCNKAPNTRDSLPIVTEWLRRCCESHPLCENNGRKQYIPTRLLDLRNNQARVCQMAGISGNINYATLSHCWGKLPFLVLKTDNLAEFSQQIPSNALPKTFQHAIEITRYLGLQFLWIDSLCIVQDDSNDWKRESALMTQVYGASTINLAASGAANGSEGCFFERHPAWRCQIPTPMKGLSFEVSQQLWDCYPKDFRKSLLDMPLLKRGWVLQERMLARRILHFTRTEVFWECDTVSASETFPDRLQPKISKQISIIKRPLSTNKWPQIVTTYSNCLLTFQKDKLTALSGLAQLIHRNTKAQYAAGLWVENLGYQLRWFSSCFVSDEFPGVQRRISSAYRAPSWSWASVDMNIDCPTFMPVTGDRLYISVHHVHVENEPPGNTFGEIVSARLRLRCDHLLHDRRMPDDPSGQDPHSPFLHRKGNGIYTVYDSSEPLELLLLPVIYNGDHGYVFGLWLQATGEHRGEYRRIGVFSRSKSQPDSDFWDGDRIAGTPAEDWEYSHIEIDEHGKQQRYIDLI